MPLRIGASVESTECHQCLGYDSVATPQPLLPAGMDLQHLIKMSAELFFFGVLGVGAAAFYNFPPKQRILGFLVETIDWYRLLSVEQQIATEPDGTRCSSKTIVRLVWRSSVFRLTSASAAVAFFEARTSLPAEPKGQRNRASSGRDFQHLAVMESKSSAEAQQAANDLNQSSRNGSQPGERIAKTGPRIDGLRGA